MNDNIFICWDINNKICYLGQEDENLIGIKIADLPRDTPFDIDETQVKKWLSFL